VYASLTLCVVNNRPCYLPGIEARGFIFGPAIALAIGAKFIPLRKPKKLPGNVCEQVIKYGPKQTNKDIVMGGVKSYCTSELDILTHMITLKEPTSYILHIHSTLENFILPPFIFICHFRLTHFYQINYHSHLPKHPSLFPIHLSLLMNFFHFSLFPEI
jgi:hypothetical protein